MPSTAAKPPIRVAVGVICDGAQNILIAKRPAHLHQGGLWEFPGGKIEAGESLSQALVRELREELGIAVNPQACESLVDIEHDYGDKAVRLEVCWVRDFSGEPEGREGQPLRWVSAEALTDYAFPVANQAIIQALLNAESLSH